ncbi:MAG: hypothetical protein Q8L15_18475 [Methylobacter sp.]|nr:hypothetical protein [Methylobacter sp.]
MIENENDITTHEEEQEIVQHVLDALNAAPEVNNPNYRKMTVYALLEKAFGLANNAQFYSDASMGVLLHFAPDFFANNAEPKADEKSRLILPQTLTKGTIQ